MPEDEFDDTARIMVFDPLEFRIVIFEADTELTMSAGADAVAERARELLETEGGFIVHAIEPDGDGLAAVIEIPRESARAAEASPSEVEPGRFSLVFEDTIEEEDERVSYQITFTWEGERAASFVYDVAPTPGDPTFVAEINSDPIRGWLSWVNEKDVLIAFLHPMAEEEGWARISSVAPGAGSDEPEAALSDPETWIKLGRLIHAVTADAFVPDMSRHTYC
ncbi:hypothetical protein [Mycobacterium sp. 23]|uniref:hypothetical protein n=1 Tax=Mycobacterium sp. 23 TaxID=3400424 RepID=UPI003AAFC956